MSYDTFFCSSVLTSLEQLGTLGTNRRIKKMKLYNERSFNVPKDGKVTLERIILEEQKQRWLNNYLEEETQEDD